MTANGTDHQPLRVLSVHYAHGVGGVNTWNQRMIAAYLRRPELGLSWTTALIGGRADYESVVAAIPEEIRRHYCHLSTMNEQGDQFNQWRAVEATLQKHAEWRHVDVVIPNDISVGWLLPQVIQARFDLRPAVIGAIHCDQDYHYRFCGEGANTLEGVFGVSRRCQAEFSRRYPSAPAPEFIPYGVPVAEDASRDCSDGPLRLVFCGRLIQYHKRSLDLIPLVEELQRRAVEFELHVLGEGDCLPQLQAELLRLAPGRVTFHAPLPPDQVPGFLRQHHVILNLSDFEGTSISMLEAMGQGLVPVVTQIDSGVNDVIAPGRNGWTVPVGDMWKMADTLALLAGNRTLLHQAGYQARERVACEYNLDQSASALAAFLHAAADLPRSPYRVNYRTLWLGRLDRPWVPGCLTLLARRVQRLVQTQMLPRLIAAPSAGWFRKRRETGSDAPDVHVPSHAVVHVDLKSQPVQPARPLRPLSVGTLADCIRSYRNQAECNETFYATFTEQTNAIDLLKSHRDLIEQNQWGHGERAFHYLWWLLFGELFDRGETARCCEIGVYKGQVISLWSRMAAEMQVDVRVTAISPFEGNMNPCGGRGQSAQLRLRCWLSRRHRDLRHAGSLYPYENYLHTMRDVFQAFGLDLGRVRLICGYSHQPKVFDQVKDERFDILYIDGDHTYAAVVNDILQYTPLVADGGYLVMDDAAFDLPGNGYFKGYSSVARACALLPNLGFVNVLNIGHNRLFRKQVDAAASQSGRQWQRASFSSANASSR